MFRQRYEAIRICNIIEGQHSGVVPCTEPPNAAATVYGMRRSGSSLRSWSVNAHTSREARGVGVGLLSCARMLSHINGIRFHLASIPSKPSSPSYIVLTPVSAAATTFALNATARSAHHARQIRGRDAMLPQLGVPSAAQHTGSQHSGGALITVQQPPCVFVLLPTLRSTQQANASTMPAQYI